MKKLLSAREVWESKRIYWITSYKVVLKYMEDYQHILKPITTGKNSGKRYYVSEQNLTEFVRTFESNELK
ncbi:MAG TPA: hypothetical protein VJH55_02260 [Candidatus Paceibacterota bacterium]